MALIDFYYDFRSSYAYLATTRLEQLRAVGGEISWRPVFIDVLLSLQQEREPWAPWRDTMSPPKRAHFMADILRLITYWKVPFAVPSPVEVREKLGLLPDGEVELEVVEQAVRIRKVRRSRGGGGRRRKSPVARQRGRGAVRMTTDEILVLIPSGLLHRSARSRRTDAPADARRHTRSNLLPEPRSHIAFIGLGPRVCRSL